MQQVFIAKEMKKVDSKLSISTIASTVPVTSVYKKYTKITEYIKSEFIDRIINQNCSIKKASEELNINYSSAKGIISNYREKTKKKFKGSHKSGKKVSFFREIDFQNEQNTINMTIVTSIGGMDTMEKNVQLSKTKTIKKVKVHQIVKPNDEM